MKINISRVSTIQMMKEPKQDQNCNIKSAQRKWYNTLLLKAFAAYIAIAPLAAYTLNKVFSKDEDRHDSISWQAGSSSTYKHIKSKEEPFVLRLPENLDTPVDSKEHLQRTLEFMLDSVEHFGRLYELVNEVPEQNKIASLAKNAAEKYESLAGKDLEIDELDFITRMMCSLQDPEVLSQIGVLVNYDMAGKKISIPGVDRYGETGYFDFIANKSELGGFGTFGHASGSRMLFVPYEPLQYFSDTHYKNAIDCESAFMADFDFHLHATKKQGNLFGAGPSDSDIINLKGKSACCRRGIVITYIGRSDKGTIKANVDYYNNKGVVIDLGVYDTNIFFAGY